MNRLLAELNPGPARASKQPAFIDRAGIASHAFNAHDSKIAADGRLPNLDHLEEEAIRG
jgi:hypothetical protein